MITHEDVKAFVAVAKHESFVNAAEELHITPPALSRRIKKLEEYVGDALFARTTQMVEITPSGRILLERASVIVRDFQSFKDFAGRFVDDHSVMTRFACMWSTAGSVVPSLIRDYTRTHENAEFDVQDANAGTVARLVAERQVDFGISMRPSENEEIEFVALCEDPLIVACPPGHPLYHKRSVTWRELTASGTGKIDWGVIRSIYVGTFKDDLDNAEVPHTRGAAIHHLSTQLAFLESHLRAIVMPLLGATLARAPGIKCIPVTRPILKREIGIVKLHNANASRAVSPFLQHLEARFLEHYYAATQQLKTSTPTGRKSTRKS